MKNRFLKVLLLTLFMHQTSYALEGIKNPKVSFEALGKPSFLKIKGESSQLKHHTLATEAGVEDIFEFDLKSLDSGIELRDEHMKNKYLKVKDYPTAKLTLKSPEHSALVFEGEQDLKGLFTLKDKSNEVSIHAKRSGDLVTANFEIKLSDYGMEIPSWSGIRVSDLVKVATTFEVIQEAPPLVR
ncbi:MAG: YceI family protein [Bdellovibrionota bacterium]